VIQALPTEVLIMNALSTLFQIVIALGILNVWLLRFGRSTEWRGGDAQNMKEEFANYGLPPWFMIAIGIAKVGLASVLIAGLWLPEVSRFAALGMVALMLGAVSMHIKVGDPLRKSLPAFSMLAMSSFVAFVG
jgi:uncharacterized membrane protein YphA (DoxX/SURF4 family)